MKQNRVKKAVTGWASVVIITLWGGGLVAAEAKPTATIEPNVFPVYEQVCFKVRIKPGKRLGPGSKIECQLPNSFTNDKVSPSKVKQWQTENPTGPPLDSTVQ